MVSSLNESGCVSWHSAWSWSTRSTWFSFDPDPSPQPDKYTQVIRQSLSNLTLYNIGYVLDPNTETQYIQFKIHSLRFYTDSTLWLEVVDGSFRFLPVFQTNLYCTCCPARSSDRQVLLVSSLGQAQRGNLIIEGYWRFEPGTRCI